MTTQNPIVAVRHDDGGPLTGTDCDEQLFGAQGRDVISGLGGADVIYDGGDIDILRGGTGADQFLFARDLRNDSVLDFSVDEGDQLNLTAWSVYSVDALEITEEVRFDRAGTALYRIKIEGDGDTIYLRNAAWSLRARDLGVDQFVLRPRPQDQTPVTLQGTNQSETIRGSGSDEVLADFGGVDKLFGGAGVDRFVLFADGQVDYIKDYQAGEAVDITRWDVDAITDLSVTKTRGGKLVLRHDDEVLIVQGARDGDAPAALESDAFLEALVYLG